MCDADCRMGRERGEIVANHLASGRQSPRVGRMPAIHLQQFSSRGVDIVFPRREDPHVSPLLERGADAWTALENQWRHTALHKARGRREAHGAGADDDDRQDMRRGS